jgi:hypothetical protein
VNGERRIEDRRRHGLVVAHRLEAAERGAGLVNGGVGAAQAVPPEDFVEHERPAGVGDICDQRSAAQIGDALDFRLDEQMIEAVVAAGHDDGVHLRRLDQRHALIGGAVHDPIDGRLVVGCRWTFALQVSGALAHGCAEGFQHGLMIFGGVVHHPRQSIDAAAPTGYSNVKRQWHAGDVVELGIDGLGTARQELITYKKI